MKINNIKCLTDNVMETLEKLNNEEISLEESIRMKNIYENKLSNIKYQLEQKKIKK